MEKHFNIEKIKDPKRVKVSSLKLKGHSSLWWENVEANNVKKGKYKVNTWDRMVTKLKDKFLYIDDMISLFKKLQTLQQKEMTMK